MITSRRYALLKVFLEAEGYGADLRWAESVGSPRNADAFGIEAAFVILNSGMKASVAAGIWARVRPRLHAGLLIQGSGVFGHDAKAQAIDWIWANRADLFARFLTLATPEAQLDFLEALPWIGPVTKFHLAKNFGLEVAKPDRWLVRLAEAHGRSVDDLCLGLAHASGDRVGLVDLVLWRACESGAIRVSGSEVLPAAPWLIERWGDE